MLENFTYPNINVYIDLNLRKLILIFMHVANGQIYKFNATSNNQTKYNQYMLKYGLQTLTDAVIMMYTDLHFSKLL